MKTNQSRFQWSAAHSLRSEFGLPDESLSSLKQNENLLCITNAGVEYFCKLRKNGLAKKNSFRKETKSAGAL